MQGSKIRPPSISLNTPDHSLCSVREQSEIKNGYKIHRFWTPPSPKKLRIRHRGDPLLFFENLDFDRLGIGGYLAKVKLNLLQALLHVAIA